MEAGRTVMFIVGVDDAEGMLRFPVGQRMVTTKSETTDDQGEIEEKTQGDAHPIDEEGAKTARETPSQSRKRKQREARRKRRLREMMGSGSDEALEDALWEEDDLMDEGKAKSTKEIRNARVRKRRREDFDPDETSARRDSRD